MGTASILLLVTIGIAWLSPALTTRHEVLQSILSIALANVFNDTSLGKVEGLCSNLPNKADRTRVACCGTSNGNVLYLNNVQISKGKLVFFTGDSGSAGPDVNMDGSSRRPPAQLPPITSLVRRKVTEFRLPLELRAGNFTSAKCTSYFEGTLHVIGRQTTHNLYHALNDNVLPLLSLVVLDAYLRPELLHAPRALLTGYQPPTDREQVPHLEALLRAAVPRHFALGGAGSGSGGSEGGGGSVSSADGVCFRRVAWGGGVKVVYQHLLGALRRQSSDLLRELALLGFQPPDPYTAEREVQRRLSAPSLRMGRGSSHARTDRPAGPRGGQIAKSDKSTNKVKLHRQPAPAVFDPSASRAAAGRTQNSLSVLTSSGRSRPMNIVIYTRGTSGVGRTIAGEALLRDRLRELGANAIICCDFRNVTFAEQLGYAVHADVIVGLHGAGLVNSILAPTGVVTVELKTIYGYGLTLFAVCTEARQGTFVELDIRGHHIWGAPGQSRNHPIDDALIDRVTAALFAVIDRRNASASTAGHAGAVTESYFSELSALQGSAFGKTLFAALPRPAPRPGSSAVPPGAAGKKLLGGGDLIVHPYPTAALEQAATLGHTGPGAASGGNSSASRSVEEFRGLDFLQHVLGPIAMEAPAQCARMSLSAYWKHVGEKSVREKYCLTC